MKKTVVVGVLLSTVVLSALAGVGLLVVVGCDMKASEDASVVPGLVVKTGIDACKEMNRELLELSYEKQIIPEEVGANISDTVQRQKAIYVVTAKCDATTSVVKQVG